MKLSDKFIDQDIGELKLTNQELRVCHYISEHINTIGNVTAKEIAEECFCTTTTVNRFCKKYGVSGYSDFSAIIGYELRHVEDEITYDKKIDNEFLGKIDKNRTLFLFGSGSSLYSAHLLQRYLLRHGYTVILLEDRYLLKEVMREQIMLLSSSGLTAPALDLGYTAKNLGITTFAVTSAGSELDKICDYTLTFNNNVENMGEGNPRSQQKMYNTLLKLIE